MRQVWGLSRTAPWRPFGVANHQQQGASQGRCRNTGDRQPRCADVRGRASPYKERGGSAIDSQMISIKPELESWCIDGPFPARRTDLRDLPVDRRTPWHREGRLHPGQYFPYSWTWSGEPLGSISVRTEAEAVVLMFRSRSSQKMASGCLSSSACRLPGLHAALAAHALGFAVPSTAAVDIAGAALRRSTQRANYSHAGTVTGWPMRGNRNGGSERHGRFERDWEGA
jgi:hypothetical protein